MCRGDARLRHELTDFGGNSINIRHPVMDEEYLPFPHKFASNSGSNLGIGTRPYKGQHGMPLFRRGRQR